MKSNNQNKVVPNPAPFQTLCEASKTTGLAVYFLREGCRRGTIPCIKSGKKFLVNVPALLQKLDAESRMEVV